MSRKQLLYPFAAVAMLCLFTPSYPAQANENPSSQPVTHTTWGAIKALYRAETAAEQSPTPSTIQKPGVGVTWNTSADKTWWKGLSQGQRDAAVLNAAVSEYNRLKAEQNTNTPYSGYQCKPWANHIVPIASRGVAYLPGMASYCMWYPGTYVRAVGYGPAGVTIEGARPGHIVQMQWGSGPHTAIIYSVDAYGMNWIDSNFHLPYDYRLRIHYIKYSDFHTKSSDCYTVYQVIGG